MKKIENSTMRPSQAGTQHPYTFREMIFRKSKKDNFFCEKVSL